jgi:hypothetical protein
MACLADGLDFFYDMVAGNRSSKLEERRSGSNAAVTFCYIAVVTLWFLIYGRFSNMDFSAIITGASVVQLLGWSILSVKIRGSKSAAGLSSKTLTMWVIHYCCRLCSTTLRNGYVPVDRSGDGAYQLVDFMSLCTVLHLLYCVHKTYAHTYQEEHDSLPLGPLVAGCFTLSLFIRGNLIKVVYFDMVWTMSAYAEIFAMVPQLWMMAQQGGQVDGLTGHYVACIVISGVLTWTFWWWTYPQMEKRGGVAGHVMLCLQTLKLIFSADFMYYYAMAFIGGTNLVLPASEL